MLIKYLVKDGIQALQEGRRSEAVEIFESILNLDPTNVEAWVWLSTCTDTLEKRRECLEKALALDPNHTDARTMLDAITRPRPVRSQNDQSPRSRSKLFICYRRDDSGDTCGRLYDHLVARFGAAQIFRDVDSIPLGVDFKDHIDQIMRQCAVMLALIGPHWLSMTDESGQRRLDDASDFVRIEIESALNQNIAVIPLLVQGASLPSADVLPPGLAKLAYRNGLSIRRDPDFHNDMQRLLSGLERLLA